MTLLGSFLEVAKDAAKAAYKNFHGPRDFYFEDGTWKTIENFRDEAMDRSQWNRPHLAVHD